jgi:hypothetical protein
VPVVLFVVVGIVAYLVISVPLALAICCLLRDRGQHYPRPS